MLLCLITRVWAASIPGVIISELTPLGDNAVIFGGLAGGNITLGVFSIAVESIVAENTLDEPECDSNLRIKVADNFVYISCLSNDGDSRVVRHRIEDTQLQQRDNAFFIELANNGRSNTIDDLTITSSDLILTAYSGYPTALRYFLECENGLCRQDQQFGSLLGKIREWPLTDLESRFNSALLKDNELWIIGKGALIAQCPSSGNLCQSGSLLTRYSNSGQRESGFIIESFGSGSQHQKLALLGDKLYVAGTTDTGVYITRYTTGRENDGYDSGFRIDHSVENVRRVEFRVSEQKLRLLIIANLIEEIVYTFGQNKCDIRHVNSPETGTYTQALSFGNGAVVVSHDSNENSEIDPIPELAFLSECQLTPPAMATATTEAINTVPPVITGELSTETPELFHKWGLIVGVSIPSAAVLMCIVGCVIMVCASQPQKDKVVPVEVGDL